MSETRPNRGGRIGWAVTTLCLAVACYFMALQGMIDMGAAAHDAFCAEHGWAV